MNRVFLLCPLLALFAACSNFTTEKPVCRGEAIVSFEGLTGKYLLKQIDGEAAEALVYTVTEPTPKHYRISVNGEDGSVEEVDALVCKFGQKYFLELTDSKGDKRQIVEMVKTGKGVSLFFQTVKKEALEAASIPFRVTRTHFEIDNTDNGANEKLVPILQREKMAARNLSEIKLEKIE